MTEPDQRESVPETSPTPAAEPAEDKPAKADIEKKPKKSITSRIVTRLRSLLGSVKKLVQNPLFVATLLGTLLGAAADFSEATNLIGGLIELANPSPHLRIAGSNTVLGTELGLAAEWQENFEAQKTTTLSIPIIESIIGEVTRMPRITVSGVGSITGFEMARKGEVDLLVMSEPMDQERYQQLMDEGIEVECAARIGYDLIAFVTNINNKLPEIPKRDLNSILRGSVTNWDAVGGEDQEIKILARHGSGTTELILIRFTGGTDIPAHFLTLRPPCLDEGDDSADGCEPCGSNEACLDKALNLPGSLYWVSVAWLHTQPPRYLELVKVPYDRWIENPMLAKCTEELVRNDEPCFEPTQYEPSLIRPLYMYVLSGDKLDDDATALAREFLHYVRGVDGQNILENRHFHTHLVPLTTLKAGEEQPVEFFEPQPDGTLKVCRE